MNLRLLRLLSFAVLLSLFAAIGFGQNPAQDKKDAANLAKLGKQRDAAKLSMTKHPGNQKLTHSFVEMNDVYANKTMTAGWLSPHEKYSKALRLYRESLKADPKDPEARKWVDEIESIYKSMGRPIPK
jgi:hypothetical protein